MSELDDQFENEIDLDSEFDKELSAAELVEQEPVTPESDITQGEALLGGVQSGAMLGARDEIAGAVGAPAYLYGKYGSVSEAWKHRDELGDEYRRVRDEDRTLQAQQAEAHPKTYMAGEVGGSLLTPSLGVAKLGKLKKLNELSKTFKSQKALKALAGVKGKTKLQLAAQLAAGGAATGLGVSEADLTRPTKEGLKAAAIDTVLGGALGVAVPAAMKAVGRGVKKAFDPVAMKNKAEDIIFNSVKSKASMKSSEFIKNRKQEAGIGEALLQKVYDPELGKEVPLMSYIKNPVDLSKKIGLAMKNQYNELQKPFEAAQFLIDQAEPLLRKARLERLGPSGAKGTDLTDKIATTLKNDFGEILDMHGVGPEFEAAKKRIIAFTTRHEAALNGYDLKELTKVKRILGEKVKPATWLTAVQNGSLPEEQAIWLNMSFAIKEHVENLATKVSHPSRNLGKEIKTINKKISQLIDTDKLADYDAVHGGSQPSILRSKYVVPVVMSRWNPVVAGFALGSYAIEKATGRKLGDGSQLVTAKGLNSLSKKIASSEKDGAIAIAKKIKDLELLPIVERSGAIVRLLSDVEDVTGISISKPPTGRNANTGINSPTNINKFESDELTELHQMFVKKYGENDIHAQALGKILAQEKTSRRKARQFTLNSTPAFQEKVKEIYGETKDENK